MHTILFNIGNIKVNGRAGVSPVFTIKLKLIPMLHARILLEHTRLIDSGDIDIIKSKLANLILSLYILVNNFP